MADGLLWIGHSYHPFYCGSTGPCAANRCCFVHEAEWRGISRKLRAAPRWREGGEHRIFLAHRGEHSTTDLGNIYGYFDLHRIEVIGNGHGRPAGVPNWRQPERRTDHRYLDDVIDAMIERVDNLVDERRQLTRAPLDPERFANPRRCRSKQHHGSGYVGTGWRESPGAVYAVDALCAEITDAWAELVRWLVLEPRVPWAPAPEFELLLNRLHRTKRAEPLVTVPGELEELATHRGALVLFNAPPTWQAFPVASSQSLIQVDGAHLLSQVAAGHARVKVRRLPDPKAHQDLAAELACEYGVNLHLAEEFLATVTDVTAQPGIAIKRSDGFVDEVVELLEKNDESLLHRHDELRSKCERMLTRASRKLAKQPVA